MSGKNTTTPAKQDGFKSQWGFIMAAVGSCVGMANVWRFPMLVSRYGGLTFLIPYFIFAIVISQSGMMEEFSLGRWAGYGPVGSFGKAMEMAVSPRRLENSLAASCVCVPLPRYRLLRHHGLGILLCQNGADR